MFKRKKKDPEVIVEPTDPIIPCGVEKLETVDDQVVLLDSAKITHAIEGRIISGNVVDPNSGKTTFEIRVISMNKVVRHTAMGWRNSDRSMHELPNVTPESLTR